MGAGMYFGAVATAGALAGGYVGYRQATAVIPEHSKDGYVAGNLAAAGLGLAEGTLLAGLGGSLAAAGMLGDTLGAATFGVGLIGAVPGLLIGSIAGMVHEHGERTSA